MSERIQDAVIEQAERENEARRTWIVQQPIEELKLSCVICKSPVPMRRARGRSKDTCSTVCHSVLRKFRKFCIESTVCPACYHPSTLQERADFREWRKERGHIRKSAGRPPLKPKPSPELERCISTLDAQRLLLISWLGAMLRSECTLDENQMPIRDTLPESEKEIVSILESHIEWSKKLIDTQGSA